MGLAILLGLAVAVFVLYTIIDRVLDPTTETTSAPGVGVSGTVATLVTSTTVPATNTTRGGNVGGSVLVRPQAATASSSLKATSITDFRPTNMLDGNLSSAWVEGAEGIGIGEWARFEFDAVIPLDRIEIANGYQKDDERFLGNSRVKTLEVEYSDGTEQVVELRDVQGLQAIQPEVQETQWIKLTILSVYADYTWDDTALSDVRVYETVQ
jgi:hypothetical protein